MNVAALVPVPFPPSSGLLISNYINSLFAFQVKYMEINLLKVFTSQKGQRNNKNIFKKMTLRSIPNESLSHL